MTPAILILFYLAVVTLPLAASWAVGGPARSFWPDVASGLGILAYTIMLTEFVLAGRFRVLSARIGMDVIMRFHQMMGRTALGFAMVHPFLYSGTPSGGPRPWDPTRQLSVTSHFSDLVTGILAYLLLPSLILLAVGRKQLDYSYERWRLMHGLGAAVIAGLLWHHTVHAGRYGSHPVMWWLWLLLTAAAIGALVFVYVGIPLLKARRGWRVASVRRLSPRQWELTVSPEGHAGLGYRAGQFAWLTVGRPAYSLHQNPFSLSSAPAGGPNLSFMIKELGDFTRTVGLIAPGTKAYVDGPFGSLHVDGRTEPGIVLIAGGVGLAPLLGILRQLRLTEDTRPTLTIYGNRRAEQIVFRDELDRGDVVYVLYEPSEDWPGEVGVIDAALLDRVLSDDQIRDWLVVMCGPPEMMDGVEQHLIARGVSAHRILSERFDYD